MIKNNEKCSFFEKFKSEPKSTTNLQKTAFASQVLKNYLKNKKN